MRVTVSAPGKIHLMGEHVVVYGKPALLSAVNCRVYVTISTPNIPNLPNTPNNLQDNVEKVVKDKYHLSKIGPYDLKINSAIPVGCGMGSSAAVCAAYIGALLSFLGKAWNPNLINELAYEVEKIFHGTPSGGDNTTVVFGGFLWFRREFEFLKSMWQLPFKPHKNFKQFILIQSGKPVESTKEMVEIVGIKKQESRSKVGKIFNGQEEVAKDMTLALKIGDEDKLIDSIKRGEKNLEKLGVVGKRARVIVRNIEKIGGAAKISGAGGVKGGSGMLLSYHKNPKVILELAKKHNLEAFPITLGEEGIRVY